ncbi:ferredoxin [Patescibacteria group bacterium]|nr:ferredoxin [Patescibacteria group bacterium]
MFKVKVDKEKCIGCGSCAAICPTGFEMKDGKASPVKDEIESLGCNKTAEENCPVEAISIDPIKSSQTE